MRVSQAVAAACLFILVAACREQEQPASAAPPTESTPATSPPATSSVDASLVSLPTGANDQQFEIGIGACAAAACPIEVRLREAGQLKDTARLEWTATTSAVQESQPDTAIGPVDPLREDSGLRVWSIGEGEQAVLVGVRSVQLEDGSQAVLLDQVAGFEHIARRHDLYAVLDGKLVNVWSSVQPQGPSWSAVSVAAGGQLILLRSFDPDPSQSEVLTAATFSWNKSQRVMQAAAAPTQLSAAQFGPFPSAPAAREQRQANPACLAAFRVLDAARLDPAAKGVVLAALRLDSGAAQRALEQASQCAPQLGAAGVKQMSLAAGA